MSRFHGPQQRGAGRQARADRRRQIATQERKTAALANSDARTCPGKVRYASTELAEGRARSINAMTGDDMHAYACSACGWIHLGHVSGATGLRHGRRYESAADRTAGQR